MTNHIGDTDEFVRICRAFYIWIRAEINEQGSGVVTEPIENLEDITANEAFGILSPPNVRRLCFHGTAPDEWYVCPSCLDGFNSQSSRLMGTDGDKLGEQ
jgi:hypothetical protein